MNNSSYLLREVLLLSYGIESDIQWDSTENGISAIDLQLLPPSASELISRIKDLGKTYSLLESITTSQQDNPYFQALYDAVESYLDNYRDSIVSCDDEIRNHLITTLTGLIARLEPFQFELQFFGRIIPPLNSMSPLSLLNKIHQYAIVSPTVISKTIQIFEQAIHQVAIYQLTGFCFYHQVLPDIFELKPNKTITYAGDGIVTFLPHQHAELLLLIVNLTSKHEMLFETTNPPEEERINQWIILMAKTTSSLLADQLRLQWPKFFIVLTQFILFGESNYISELAKRIVQGYATAYDLNQVISRYDIPQNLISIELPKNGMQLKFNLKPPLSLIINDEHQKTLSDFFKIFISLITAQTALNEMWNLKMSDYETSKLLFFSLSFIHRILGLIRDYIVHTVITPALVGLEKASQSITDYLKFQSKFSEFIFKIRSTFFAFDINVQEGMQAIADSICNLNQLLIKKGLASKISKIDLRSELMKIGQVVNENIPKIAESSSEEENEFKISIQNWATALNSIFEMKKITPKSLATNSTRVTKSKGRLIKK